METATEERSGLAAVEDPPADDVQPESEAAALEREAEEERKRELEAKEAEEAAAQLAFPVGGIKPTKARIQITGGAVDIPPAKMPRKDEELEVVVRGWIKTDKSTTEGKGGIAVREAVFVVEGVELPDR